MTNPSTVVQAQKVKLATQNALPPIIVTALAMKELSKNNDLLSLEGAHERSSIIFNPSFKNSTVNDPATKPIITQEYEELLGNLSNISLDKDVALGAMTSLMDQTAISEPDPEDISMLEKSFSGVQEKFTENLQRIHVHNAKLNEIREGMEETYLSKQAHLDELNETVAKRNKEVAINNAEISRLEREVTLITETKNQQITELEEQLQEATEEAEKLKDENRQKVPASELFAAEDQVTDLQEKLDSQARRTKLLQSRLESVKIDAKSRLDMMKTENRALSIKKEHLEKTLREEKQSVYDLKRELGEMKTERDTLQQQKDDLELSVQSLRKDSRRLSSTKEELEQLHTRLSSRGSESDVFGSPTKGQPTSAYVQKMVSPETFNTNFIMSTDNKNKTSESVSKLLPKWTTGENVRNYTKRIQHAWNFVKDNFEQEKFINLVRISVTANMGEIIDNFLDEHTDATNRTVEKLCQALVTKLDKRPSEYITEFKTTSKLPSESYSAYAHRLKELYKKGTECAGAMGQGERRLLVEQFLEGLPYSESSTLKLVASDKEMLDVDQLALRASRSGKPKRNVAVVGEKTGTAKPDPAKTTIKPWVPTQDQTRPTPPTQGNPGNSARGRGARFNCHYCSRFGHSWRACFKRARENSNWRPAPRAGPRDIAETSKNQD